MNPSSLASKGFCGSFLALFLFFSVSLRCLLLPKPGFVPDVPPSQIKTGHSSCDLCLSAVQVPRDSASRASHGTLSPQGLDFMWTRPGAQVPQQASTSSSSITALLWCHPGSPPSWFSIFLGRFSTNRKQLPCWDSSLPLQ